MKTYGGQSYAAKELIGLCVPILATLICVFILPNGESAIPHSRLPHSLTLPYTVALTQQKKTHKYKNKNKHCYNEALILHSVMKFSE